MHSSTCGVHHVGSPLPCTCGLREREREAEIFRLRSELHSIRDTTIEDCATSIRDIAKVAALIDRGGINAGLELAETAVRALKDKNPREE